VNSKVLHPLEIKHPLFTQQPFELVTVRTYNEVYKVTNRLIRWPCGLRRKSEVALILGSPVRIPLRVGYSSLVNVECCVGSGHWEELITCTEESYCARARVCECVCVRVSECACECV
jgi:hypothetical protein